MRISDFTGKEVINLGDGSRLGVIDDCEFTFDGKTGHIEALIIPNRGGIFNFFGDNKTSAIPWPAIKRIGEEVIIVDLNNAYERGYSSYRRERQRDAY